MLSEKEKMQRAKHYLLMLCNGIDPITNETVDQDTLKSERIIKCFRYIAGVLDDAIGGKARGGSERKTSKTKSDFYITDEELKRVVTSPDGCAVSELASAINEAVNDESRKKLQSKNINDWLVVKGYLKNSIDSRGRNHRELTERSSEIGITSMQGIGSFGPYTIVLYSEDAQRFILENINEIIKLKEK